MADALFEVSVATDVLPFAQPTPVNALPSEFVSLPTFEAPATVNTASNPSIETLDPAAAAFTGHFLYDYYYRIWVIPETLIAINPQINEPISFVVWNAYPYPNTNTLTAINPVGGDGLTFDVTPPDVFERLEYRTVSITIGDDAPNSINALFTFDFSTGDGLLTFLATLSELLPIAPNFPIVEKYNWLSNVVPYYDGNEQRIALRIRPRRSLKYELTIVNDSERKLLLDKLYSTAASALLLPTYQFKSLVKQTALAGTDIIYANTKRADLRADEHAVVITKTGESIVLKVLNVFDDRVQLTQNLAVDIAAGSSIFNAFTGRIPDQSGLSMNAIDGTSSLSFDIVEVREQMGWPDTGFALPTFDGLPILRKNPLAAGETNEALSVGRETIDNGTGKPQYYTAWAQPYIKGHRTYLCQSLLDLDDLQFWLNFFDYCRGQQKPFYTPTYRYDLIQYEGSDFIQTQVVVDGVEYAAQYFSSETYKRLQIETNLGTFEVKADSAIPDGDKTVINFAVSIPDDLTGVEIYRISYLMLVRLGSDEVTFSHYPTYSTIEMDIKALSDANV